MSGLLNKMILLHSVRTRTSPSVFCGLWGGWRKQYPPWNRSCQFQAPELVYCIYVYCKIPDVRGLNVKEWS